jgi:Holliday junction resolvase RusA-like endonuclease
MSAVTVTKHNESDTMKLFFACELPGRPIVKKNTQRIVGVGKGRRRILSPKYIAWERGAYLHAIAARSRANRAESFGGLVFAKFFFHFLNKQAEADVSNLIEGPQDLLVKAGVLKDDRQIVALFAQKEFGLPAKTIIELYGASA